MVCGWPFHLFGRVNFKTLDLNKLLAKFKQAPVLYKKRWEISWRLQICSRFLQKILFKRDISLLKVRAQEYAHELEFI